MDLKTFDRIYVVGKSLFCIVFLTIAAYSLHHHRLVTAIVALLLAIYTIWSTWYVMRYARVK